MTDQLVYHLALAKQNGLTRAGADRGDHPPRLHAGWPKAMAAITTATQVFRGD